MESKTVEDICDLLSEKGFSEEVVEGFRGEEMDGAAVCTALASCPGPDCLKDVVKKCGPRLKVYSTLKAICNDYEAFTEKSPQTSSSSTGTDLVLSSSSPCAYSNNDTILCDDTTSRKSFQSNTSSLIVTPKRVPSLRRASKCRIPHPFPIPPFRQGTMNNLEKELLVDSDRKYIVQTLATVLMTHVQRPSLENCSVVAKSLVEKYTFLKDTVGEGEHSWKWYIYNRCQNVNRSIPNDESSTPRKYIKLEIKSKHAYPLIPDNTEDDLSYERNLELLKSELAKPSVKQRSELLKTLMKRTFCHRRKWILDASSVMEIVGRFPLLKKATYGSLEFSSVIQKFDTRDSFDENLVEWLKAVIYYAKETQTRSTILREKTALFSEQMDPGACVVLGLQCLFHLFTSNKEKNLSAAAAVPFVLKTVPRGTPLTEAPDKNNNQPHIVVIRDLDEDEDEDICGQYFIAVEQSLMLESSNIFAAVFYLVAAHYIFNLQYHPKVTLTMLFLQEKVLGLPSSNVRRTPTAVTHFTGISRMKEKRTKQEDHETPDADVDDLNMDMDYY